MQNRSRSQLTHPMRRRTISIPALEVHEAHAHRRHAVRRARGTSGVIGKIVLVCDGTPLESGAT
jgi:hypothetical protein